MEVRCYRLTTHEDIITRIEENLDGTVTFVKPQMILQVPTQQGFSLQFMPFLGFAAGQRITMPPSAIVFSYVPEKQLTDEYTRLVSDIQIASELPSEKPTLGLIR